MEYLCAFMDEVPVQSFRVFWSEYEIVHSLVLEVALVEEMRF